MNRFTWFEVHAVDHCTMQCLHCNNHIPHLARKEWQAEDYFPAIDAMCRRGIVFEQIGTIGGEPFLHSNLAGFIGSIKNRYKVRTTCNTNMTCINDRNIESFVPVFKVLDILYVTPYKTVVERVGNEKYQSYLDFIREHCHVVVNDWLTEFVEMGFYKEPSKPTRECSQSKCRNLLPDGRLFRCAVAAYHRQNPTVTEEFRSGCDESMFYDVHNDERDFYEWLDGYPGSACHFCHYWRTIWKPWRETKDDESVDVQIPRQEDS